MFSRFAWKCYGQAVGPLLFVAFRLYRRTIRIRWVHSEHLQHEPSIVAFWHRNLPLYFLAFPGLPGGQAWMQHPAGFMAPIHRLLRLLGANHLVFGSSGHGGRRAMEELIDRLRGGYSTVITPDGPAGPPEVLKSGVWRVAGETGLPIVPLVFRCTREIRLPTWDGKRLPLPGATLEIEAGRPVRDADPDTLTRALSRP